MQFLGKKKKWWFIISGMIILPGILALIFWGLNYGIDFKGGTILEIKIKDKEYKIEEIQETLKPLGLPGLTLIPTADKTILIKTAPVEKEVTDKEKAALKEKYGEIEEIRFESVGPTVGKDLTRKAIQAVILACVGIVLYIAFAFRNVPKKYSSFKFGLSAIFALIHDILVVVGVFSLVGHFSGYEVDAYFITAILTVLGFSVHDTIVVFDRIRENLRRFPEASFEEVANASINQTLGRSISTSFTVILTLLALFLIGGDSIKPFVFTLLVGITTGTYSSVFTATPILVLWQKQK
jgi:preprotein translocase subunit SecF